MNTLLNKGQALKVCLLEAIEQAETDAKHLRFSAHGMKLKERAKHWRKALTEYETAAAALAQPVTGEQVLAVLDADREKLVQAYGPALTDYTTTLANHDAARAKVARLLSEQPKLLDAVIKANRLLNADQVKEALGRLGAEGAGYIDAAQCVLAGAVCDFTPQELQ